MGKLITLILAALIAVVPTAAGAQARTKRLVDCATARCVALTFDDGPSRYTTKLLDLLDEAGAKGTFFVVGQNTARYPDVLKRMVAEGHELGSHTQNHANLTRLSAEKAYKEIMGPMPDLEAAGASVTLMRPPYGATNGTVGRAAERAGLAQILWTVDPEDWRVRNSAVVARRVLAHTKRGSIVLVHDIHPTTVAAMPKVIAELKRRGYELVTVSELLGDRIKPGVRLP
ncbi:polysaccharide deacetylase family protein [Nonomuraea sp. NPDC050556]|uniref:polysaccharide deacetylase family protein n=1 Tax=Nonomuraea sp. NPDC050556 TaxID=3364369 RepID=UPI0037A9FB92